ncbi:preprotein translocase subunit YajC [Novosphingobium sp. 9]|uniref:preprotein translocase subunit YajC n=1 Tax=Novosphingobium sp. 9 TaxID=2025349 RepID=UPI0021B5B736|nr:preprotein translocase subunit YajC [Novosphingobium sp. 9]
MMRANGGTYTAKMLALAGVAALALPQAAGAQTMGYDSVGTSSGPGGEPADVGATRSEKRAARAADDKGRKVQITPYIEIDQIVNAQFAPVDDVLTYTQAAVGADASITGRRNGLAASVRYEHHFGWSKNASDGDAVSGLVRGYTTLARGLTLEAGGLATRASVTGGTAISSGIADSLGNTDIYSVYAGPSYTSRIGDLDLSANYRIGYTKVGQSNAYRASADSPLVDVFDKSRTQMADLEAGFAPGTIAPVGLGVGGTFYQENISNLDQRVRDIQVRGIVTVPVSRTVQMTGSLGYEDVTMGNRDAVYDANGNPEIDSHGRYVTDKSSPRVLSYDVTGLTWDVGVMWRPSPRTSASAHIGRRYGSTSFGGMFAYAPNDRSSLNISVYDNVAGFGGQLDRTLDSLPDDFTVIRDPVTGELQGCVSSVDGGTCLSGVLGSVRSSTFRDRGIMASYGWRFGRLGAGLAAGYDRRNYIAAQGTILASADGVIDENTWINAYVNGQLGTNAGWSATAYVNWLTSTDAIDSDSTGYGITAAYYRLLTERLRATAALSLDGITRKDPSIDDIWSASALVGVRYSF